MTGASVHDASEWFSVAAGDDVVLAIEAKCADAGLSAAAVRVSGIVGSARLVVDGPDGEVTAYDAGGPATLVSCDGMVIARDGRPRLVLTSVLASALTGAPTWAAGRLVRASAVDVTVMLTRAATGEAPPVEAASGRAPMMTPEPPASVEVRSPSVSSGGGGGWGRVAAASDRARVDEISEAEVDVDELSRGDILVHPKLGNCRVLGDVSDDAVRVQVPNGSPRKLMMRVFRIFKEREGLYRLELKSR